MATTEHRRHPRHPRSGKVRLHWLTPDGSSVQISGQCLDISKTGMRVKLERKVEPGLMVRVESPDFHLAGVAYARRCQLSGLRFIAAFEFVGGLTWAGDEPE